MKNQIVYNHLNQFTPFFSENIMEFTSNASLKIKYHIIGAILIPLSSLWPYVICLIFTPITKKKSFATMHTNYNTIFTQLKHKILVRIND